MSDRVPAVVGHRVAGAAPRRAPPRDRHCAAPDPRRRDRLATRCERPRRSRDGRPRRAHRRDARCTPDTRRSPGPTSRTWSCGTRSRSCASTAATDTSRRCASRAWTDAKRSSRTPRRATSRRRRCRAHVSGRTTNGTPPSTASARAAGSHRTTSPSPTSDAHAASGSSSERTSSRCAHGKPSARTSARRCGDSSGRGPRRSSSPASSGSHVRSTSAPPDASVTFLMCIAQLRNRCADHHDVGPIVQPLHLAHRVAQRPVEQQRPVIRELDACAQRRYDSQ